MSRNLYSALNNDNAEEFLNFLDKDEIKNYYTKIRNYSNNVGLSYSKKLLGFMRSQLDSTLKFRIEFDERKSNLISFK